MAITVEEARAIADEFSAAAAALDKYLKETPGIGDSQRDALFESLQALLRASNEATTAAVGLAFGSLQNPASELAGVIQQAREKIAVLKNVGRAIRLVGGLADLAAGIMAKDPKAVVASVTNIGALLNAAA